MVKSDVIRKLMKDSERRDEYYAAGLHISMFSLRKKINNVTEFKPSEIVKFARMLGIKSKEIIWELFFDQNVEENSTEGEGDINAARYYQETQPGFDNCIGGR